MKVSLLSFCFGWVALAAPFFTVQAQTDFLPAETLTPAPTRAIQPLQVLVRSLGEKDGLFVGEVLARQPLEADVLEFTLLNDNRGVEWQQKIKLPSQAQRIMPFEFTDISASNRLFLSVEAYDRFGNTAGSGQKYITFPEKQPRVEINASEAFLDDQSVLSIDLFALNGPVKKSYVPEVKIYQGLEHSGVYEISIRLIDSVTREPISATHYKQIFKPGSFFKVVDLKSYYTNEDKSKARLELDGLSTVVLTEPVQMQVRLQDKQNIYLDNNFSLVLQPGYFTKYIDLNLPSYVKELSGDATFYLQGKKIQTVSFASEAINLEALPQEEPPKAKAPVVPPAPMVVEPKWYLTNNQILLIVSGCTLLLLLLVVVTWARQRWLAWVVISVGSCGALVGSVQALTVGRGVFPMIEWSNPIPSELMVFNPSNTNGFQYLPVKGRVFNFLTQTALIKETDFESVRFNLISPDEEIFQFTLGTPEIFKEANLSVNAVTGNYFFVLDLKALTAVTPIGKTEPFEWTDGAWQLQLIFPYQQRNDDPVYLSSG